MSLFLFLSGKMNNRTLLNRYWLVLILLAIILTRLPFLWTGYGADVDAWLVASAASTLWNTGEYTESRLPGYPLHEIISAPFVTMGGAPASNAATLCATVIAVFVWYRIAQQRGQHKRLLVLAFAFAPVVWQHSAVTLDYMWSLLFVLISLLATLHRWPTVAAIALGAASGFRPPNLIALIPLIWLMYLQKQGTRQLAQFALATFGTTILAFLPLLLKYGVPGWFIATQAEMSDVHLQIGMRLIAFFYRSIYFTGPLAFLVIAFLLWTKKGRIVEAVRSREPLLCASIAGVLTFLSLFLWLPLERAYLLPAFPFLLLMVDRFSTPRAFALVTILLVLSAFVNLDVIKADDRRAFGLNLHRGIVLQELQNRETTLRERIRVASLSPSGKSIIMTSDGPSFWLENDLVEPSTDTLLQQTLFYTSHHFRLTQKKENPNVLFIAYLKENEVDLVRSAGYHVFCLSSGKEYAESVVGYTMESRNIALIP
jgi:hypothetical protein